MRLDFFTHNRTHVISFGQALGDFFVQSTREKPWVLRLHGDMDSKKSLIALAIDRSFRPDEYKKGISKEQHSADGLTDGPVLFRNMGDHTYYNKEEFDSGLMKFVSRNPKSRVHIVSNLKRAFTFDFNSVADCLNSDVLDVDIKVRRFKSMSRFITVVAENDSMLEALSRHFCLREKPKSSAPHQPT